VSLSGVHWASRNHHRVSLQVYLVNGAFPGPPITATEGDTLVVTVHNKLHLEGLSIHWHGIKQVDNNLMDGTAFVTPVPHLPRGLHGLLHASGQGQWCTAINSTGLMSLRMIKCTTGGHDLSLGYTAMSPHVVSHACAVPCRLVRTCTTATWTANRQLVSTACSSSKSPPPSPSLTQWTES